MGRARHRDDRSLRPHSGCTNDVHQVRGVRGSLHSHSKHIVIGSLFAVSMEGTLRRPEQWMEPVDRAQDLRHQVNQPVPPADVSELVPEDSAEPFIGPVAEAVWQQDPAVMNAPRHWNRRGGALQQNRHTRQTELATDLDGQSMHTWIRYDACR